jgi:hypothetical protein
MATSDVSICNLALQKLGAARITALTDDSRNARSCNACYTLERDKELRAHPWTFATKRIVLAPDATAPAFDFDYAFSIPQDCLRILPPNTYALDWKFESNKILTNAGDTLNLVYTARIEDPTVYDPCFVEALACKMAWHMCEEITQSNQKKADVASEYKFAIADAKKSNAFEKLSDTPPEDSWVAARLAGNGWNNGRPS